MESHIGTRMSCECEFLLLFVSSSPVSLDMGVVWTQFNASCVRKGVVVVVWVLEVSTGICCQRLQPSSSELGWEMSPDVSGALKQAAGL